MLRVAVRIAVTLFVIAATATACGAESRSSQRTSAPRVVNKYISKRYRYEIVLRGKYAMIPAQVAWNGGFPFGSSGQVDVIIDPHDRKFIVAAKPVSPGMSLSRWEAFVVRLKRQACHGLRDFRASSLGGVPGREFVNSCPEYEVITLAALRKGRGYLLEYLAPSSFSAASDRHVYDAGRRAFAFTQK
jgi:hypothetical protein